MILISWHDLLKGAGYFGLDESRFCSLKPVYDAIDKKQLTQTAAVIRDEVSAKSPVAFPSSGYLRQFLLFCIVANYRKLPELYQRNGWPVEMLEGIRGDLKLWLETMLRDYGEYGLTPRIFDWERECLAGVVKSFGRLQANDIHLFQPGLAVCRNSDGTLQVVPDSEKEKLPKVELSRLDKVINIHIPASGALKREDCLRSLLQMVKFSEKYNPDHDFKAIVCYSWLLDKQFQQLLKPDSNILKFQHLGHLVQLPDADQTEEVRWRIWGEKYLHTPADKLPVNNSMEKSVAGFLASGGSFNEGLLIIFKDEADSLLTQIEI